MTTTEQCRRPVTLRASISLCHRLVHNRPVFHPGATLHASFFRRPSHALSLTLNPAGRYTICASRGGAVAARRAHNPKVVGSNPTPATTLAAGPHSEADCTASLPTREQDGNNPSMSTCPPAAANAPAVPLLPQCFTSDCQAQDRADLSCSVWCPSSAGRRPSSQL